MAQASNEPSPVPTEIPPDPMAQRRLPQFLLILGLGESTLKTPGSQGARLHQGPSKNPNVRAGRGIPAPQLTISILELEGALG